MGCVCRRRAAQRPGHQCGRPTCGKSLQRRPHSRPARVLGPDEGPLPPYAGRDGDAGRGWPV